MKKKIMIGSFLAIFMLAMAPSISAVEFNEMSSATIYQEKITNSINGLYESFVELLYDIILSIENTVGISLPGFIPDLLYSIGVALGIIDFVFPY